MRRLQKLESRIVPALIEDPHFYVRQQAMGNLAPADWRAVVAMARRSFIYGDVENTPELQAIFARWGQATAELIARNEPLTL